SDQSAAVPLRQDGLAEEAGDSRVRRVLSAAQRSGEDRGVRRDEHAADRRPAQEVPGSDQVVMVACDVAVCYAASGGERHGNSRRAAARLPLSRMAAKTRTTQS